MESTSASAASPQYSDPSAAKSPDAFQMYGPAPTTSSHSHMSDHQQLSSNHEQVGDAKVVATNGQALSASSPSTTDANVPQKAKRKKAAPTATKDGKIDKPKEKKERKPRDPNKPPVKRRKVADADGKASAAKQPPELMPAPHPIAPNPTQPLAPQTSARLGNNEAKEIVLVKGHGGGGGAQQPRSTSSGQRYDPIRGDGIASNFRSSEKPKSPDVQQIRSPPSMAHLLSPTIPSNDSAPTSHGYPTATRVGARTAQSVAVRWDNDPMALDAGPAPAAAQPVQKSNSPKNRPSPKPARAKEALPPPPLGSGLLSNAAFGRPDEKPKQYAEVPNQCIVIEVPMGSGTGGYVNFLKEVEQKYGFDVAHPRLAEHKRRMDQIAAAGAAIESGPGSADEMIVDGSDADSNAEMGGMEEGSTAEGEKKKTRKTKKDEYNKDDDFIDDTEMVWEEQALASKDGYFVWSGPLITAGDKPTIERADGTIKRGRGGRGRGGVGRGESSARGRGTGGGRGSRGGATVRKPRVTKADRARMESEKMERERMGVMAAAPSQYPGTT